MYQCVTVINGHRQLEYGAIVLRQASTTPKPREPSTTPYIRRRPPIRGRTAVAPLPVLPLRAVAMASMACCLLACASRYQGARMGLLLCSCTRTSSLTCCGSSAAACR